MKRCTTSCTTLWATATPTTLRRSLLPASNSRSRCHSGAGGRCEIRTHERLAPLPVFKTGALNRSANLPACDRQMQIGKGKCLSALEIVSPDPHMKTAIAPRAKHRYTAFARLNLAGGSYSKRPSALHSMEDGHATRTATSALEPEHVWDFRHGDLCRVTKGPAQHLSTPCLDDGANHRRRFSRHGDRVGRGGTPNHYHVCDARRGGRPAIRDCRQPQQHARCRAAAADDRSTRLVAGADPQLRSRPEERCAAGRLCSGRH